MDDKKQAQTNGNISMALLAALGTLFCYFFQAGIWSESGDISNILLYLIGIAIFFCVFFSVSLAGSMAGTRKSLPTYMEKTIALLCAIWCAYDLYQAFRLETGSWPFHPDGYFRHTIPRFIYFAVMAMGVALAAMLIRKKMAGNKWIRAVFAGAIAFLQAWFLYAPNFFKDSFGNFDHMDAYTNSIINALDYAPIGPHSVSIYGRYGIFYMLPVKLLHLTGLNRWVCVTLTIALAGGAVFAAWYWAFSKVIQNDIVYMLAVLAVSVVSTQIFHGQYYQLLPHRYVSQAAVLAGFVYVCRREGAKGGKSRALRACMWSVVGASIVWNTETGIICGIVWMLGSLYLDAVSHGKYRAGSLAKHMAFFAAAVAGAYGFVNLYNFFVGGGIIRFATFCYPLGSQSYLIEKLQYPLSNPWAGYFLPILLLLGTIGYYFRGIWQVGLDDRQVTIVLAAVMGIGVYTYYMNRAVSSNAPIVAFPFTLAAACVIDRGNMPQGTSGFIRRLSVQQVAGSMCLVVLVSMALASVASFGATLAEKMQTTYETETLDQFAGEVKGKIPQGTAAFGMATAQLFSYMDLKTGIYIADWEDLDQSMDGKTVINQAAIDYLGRQLAENRYEYLFVNELQAKYIPDGYEETERFSYHELTFLLYKDTKHGNTLAKGNIDGKS